MISEHACDRCHKCFKTKKDLRKHLERQYPCDAGSFKCQKCSQTFANRSSRDRHCRRTCKGPPQTIADLQAELEQCKTVLAATGALGERRDLSGSGSPTVNNIQACEVNQNNVVGGDVVEGDKITNIHNNTNIFVLPAGQENTDHIQKMSLEELKDRIGLQPNETTMTRLFELVRMDEDHPENHTLLLPDVNGKEVHYKAENGWKVGTYDNRMHAAFGDDSMLLQQKLLSKSRDDSFYKSFLFPEIIQKMANSAMDKSQLKPLSDKMRRGLYELTVKLAEKYSPETDRALSSQVDSATTTSDLKMQVIIEQVRATRAENDNKSRIRLAEEQTKQLEIQLELKRLEKS